MITPHFRDNQQYVGTMSNGMKIWYHNQLKVFLFEDKEGNPSPRFLKVKEEENISDLYHGISAEALLAIALHSLSNNALVNHHIEQALNVLRESHDFVS